MDIKGIVSFQINKENNSYTFQVPLGCPWTEAIAVLEEFIPALKEQQELAAKQDAEIKAQMEAKAAAEKAAQEVVPEIVKPAQGRPSKMASRPAVSN